MDFSKLGKFTVEKEKGDILFFKDDPADYCFIIKKGRIEIFVYDSAGNAVVLDVLKDGEIFGDMALILDSPRTAGARAVCKTDLYYISRDNLFDIIERKKEFAVKLILVFRERLMNVNDKLVAVKLKKVKVMNFNDYRESLRSSQKLFKKGTVVFREFEPARFGYIIRKGAIRLVKRNPFLKEESTLTVLGPGEIFGELALIGGAKRIATAIADSDDTQLQMFDEEQFVSLLHHDHGFRVKMLKICCRRISDMDNKLENE